MVRERGILGEDRYVEEGKSWERWERKKEKEGQEDPPTLAGLFRFLWKTQTF